MKRLFCLLLALLMLASLGAQAFAEEEVLYCRICGRQIPTDSRVCPYCGEAVVHVTDAQPKAAEAAKPAESAPAETAAEADTVAVVAEMIGTPAVATDVKTALSQSNAGPSPVTSNIADTTSATATTAAAGPFNSSVRTDSPRRQVYVTKSPTSESVPYGGSCTFIAHAANATSITWYIADSSASIICAASDAPASVAGLYVSGANSDTLYLSGIPSWWNGCQVQACFTGDGGPVYTEAARIWTYAPAQESDTSGWTWLDWFKYYYHNDPYHWDYRWDWYNYWVNTPHAAPPWFHPERTTTPATVIHTGHYNPNGIDGNPFDDTPSDNVVHVGHEVNPDDDPIVYGGTPSAAPDDFVPGSREGTPPPPPGHGGTADTATVTSSTHTVNSDDDATEGEAIVYGGTPQAAPDFQPGSREGNPPTPPAPGAAMTATYQSGEGADVSADAAPAAPAAEPAAPAAPVVEASAPAPVAEPVAPAPVAEPVAPAAPVVPASQGEGAILPIEGLE